MWKRAEESVWESESASNSCSPQIALEPFALKLTIATWEVTTEGLSLLSFELVLHLQMKPVLCVALRKIWETEL